MKEFKKTIMHEIELTEETILTTEWNKNNYETLLKLIKLNEGYKTTLQFIKEFERGLL